MADDLLSYDSKSTLIQLDHRKNLNGKSSYLDGTDESGGPDYEHEGDHVTEQSPDQKKVAELPTGSQKQNGRDLNLLLQVSI